MFERFTKLAVKTVMCAQEESRSSGHNYVDCEQMFMGLLRLEDGLAYKSLCSTGLTLDSARSELEKIVPPGNDAVQEETPFTPDAKRMLELCWDEARKLKDAHIGDEHLLLGLLRVKSDRVEMIMQNLGVEPDKLQKHVIKMLAERADRDTNP
jgi:ATP-dependent Clp protease ATP-binding subunit ClpC